MKITILLATGILAGCTTTLNLSLINSRSPAINALGTNDTEATTGFEGGGQLDAQIPVAQ
ncbi:hypothetical protein [Tichowtungia aerotolerans]|uniref:Lipoprotein n=1 Tax=Tichowtungia aerotolerans TaxID=2697043 RepID=A0A6P1M8X3_9BACT|nr:hypothetical protein [Tichowtungia aerotolerans]QHI70472.1 hypothetical protein GT409_13835 [Tichowtungia aerotolerans]